MERASHDPKALITTYEGKYNHDVPAIKGGSNQTLLLLQHSTGLQTVLEQFNLQNFIDSLKETASNHLGNVSLSKAIARNIIEFLSFGFSTELLTTLVSSILLETYNDGKGSRGKAVFLQKLHTHNLMLEASCPGLYVDKHGTYWDVPLSMAFDLASVRPDSCLNYHLCLQHNSGQPKHFGGSQMAERPMSLLPGLCAKAAISIKKACRVLEKERRKDEIGTII